MRYVAPIVLALLLSLSPRAFAQAPDITGWWRADITQGDDMEPFYFHFDRDDAGALRSRFSIMVARLRDVPSGPYEVVGSELRLSRFGLTFTVAPDGSAIDGVMPPSYISGVEVPVHFVRTEPPPAIPSLPTPAESPPSPAWTAHVGSEVWAGPVLDGRRALIVAGDDGRVTAFSPRTGAQLWQIDLGSPIRATPTLRGRKLYIATDRALFALDPRNGSQIWSFAFGTERAPRLPIADPNTKWDHYSSSAAIDGSFLVVGSRDGCVYALDANTGAQHWRTCTEDLVTSTPAITRDAVYFGGFDHYGYKLSRADGRVLWRYDTHDVVPRDVTVAGDNALFGSRSYDIFAVNTQTGALGWQRHIWNSWVDSPLVLADGRIYSGTSDAVAVFAFDATTGARVWSAPMPGWTWGGVALGRDRVYVGIAGGPYSAPRTGGLTALGRTDGSSRWLLPSAPPADTHQRYGFAARPVVLGRRVFAVDLTGTIYAFDDVAR